jgi:hypothetical protein
MFGDDAGDGGMLSRRRRHASDALPSLPRRQYELELGLPDWKRVRMGPCDFGEQDGGGGSRRAAGGQEAEPIRSRVLFVNLFIKTGSYMQIIGSRSNLGVFIQSFKILLQIFRPAAAGVGQEAVRLGVEVRDATPVELGQPQRAPSPGSLSPDGGRG